MANCKGCNINDFVAGGLKPNGYCSECQGPTDGEIVNKQTSDRVSRDEMEDDED